MITSLDSEDSAIVRLYGTARAESIDESPLSDLLLADGVKTKGLRQVISIAVERTQTSCGYGVPVFKYVGDRAREQRGRRFKSS